MEQPVEEQTIAQTLDEEEAMDQSSTRQLEEQRMGEPAEKVIVEQVVEIETVTQSAIDMTQHHIIIGESSMEQISGEQLQATMPIHDGENVHVGTDHVHEHVGQMYDNGTMSQMHGPVTVDVPPQNVTAIEQPREIVGVDSSHQIVPADEQQGTSSIDQPRENLAMNQEYVMMNPTQDYVTINQPDQNVTMNQACEIVTMDQSQGNVPVIQPRENKTVNQPRENITIKEPCEDIPTNQQCENMTIDQPSQNITMNQPSENVPPNLPQENVIVSQSHENITIDQAHENVIINQPSQNITMNEPCKIIPLNQPQENVIVSQSRENKIMGRSDQSGENIIITMNEQHKNTQVDQPHEKITIDQLHENIPVEQPCENITLDQPHKNMSVEQPHENIAIDQPRENIPVGQPHENITIDQPRENIPVEQPRENITIDQPCENIPVERPRENITIDQPRENIPVERPRENITIGQSAENVAKDESRENAPMNQPRENVPINQLHVNTTTDQSLKNLTIDQSQKNITVNLPSENIPVNQQLEDEVIVRVNQVESKDPPCGDVASGQPHTIVTADQSENVPRLGEQPHVSVTRNQTDHNQPGELIASDKSSDKVNKVSQKKGKELMGKLDKKSKKNDECEKSSMNQSQPMLVFCKTCGKRKLCDVTEQLQQLFKERNLKPNSCGICQKPVEQVDTKCIQMNIKKEFDDDDYEEIKFDTLLSKNTSKTTPKVNQRKIGDKAGKNRRKSTTRQSMGTPRQSRYISTANKNEPFTSESESDNNNSDSDYEMEDNGEDDMMIWEDSKKIKTEENGEGKTSGKSPNQPDMKERKYMDPELLKYLASSDGVNSDFVCNVCLESCKFIGSFAKHISKHTHKKPIQKPYRCHECKQNFEVRGFRKHFQKHHVKPYQCSECQFSYKSERDFKGHMEYHRGIRTNYCDVCGLAFITKLDLTKHMANHGDGRTVECEYCNKSYNHVIKLRVHKRKMHQDKKLTCGLCSFTCFITEELENHMKIHSQDQLKCDKCQHVFSTQLVFDFHIQIRSCKAPEQLADDQFNPNEDINIADILEMLDARVVSHMAKPVKADEPFRCKYCMDKDFYAAKAFVHHLQQCHSGLDVPADFIFHCNLCSKQYDRKCELTKHMRSHSNIRPHECAYADCNKAYKRRDLLNRHHESHVAAGDTLPAATKLTDDEVKEILHQLHPQFLTLIVVPEDKDHPFSCKLCDVKHFKSANICLNHIKQKHPEVECPTHAYKCDQCDQTFEMKGTLQRHCLGHSDYRPFVCTFEGCGKGFKRKDKLKAHQEIHTSGGKRHMCCNCGMWFSSRSGLKKHTNNVHLKIYEHKCSFCGKAFPIKSRKDHHEKTKHFGLREWVCELCGKSYNKRVELTQHMYYHSGEKPYACDYCEYRCVRLDYLKKHVKTHSRDRPYKCSVCSEQFLLRDTLIIHLKKHHGLTSPDKLSKIEKADIPVVIKKRKLDSDVPQESQTYFCMTTAQPGTSFPTPSGDQVMYESKPNVPVEMYQVVTYPNAPPMQ